MSGFSRLFDFVDILKSTLDNVTKTILLQTGSVTEEVAHCDNVELWQQVGFASRPSNPVAKTSAAQGIAIRCGDRDRVIATRDTRGQAIYGALSDGETCIYAGGANGTAQGRILLKGNGNVALYTAQGNAAGGQSVTIQVNATDGSIKLANQYGGLSIDSSGLKIAIAGGGGIQIDSSGNVAIIGNAAALNAGSVSLGANATNPVLWGTSGPAGVASTSVKVAL